MNFRELEVLNRSLDEIRRAPRDAGVVRMIVLRPAVNARKMVDEVEIDLDEGVQGDNWRARGAWQGGPADPAAQVTLINVRAIAAVSPDESQWPEAGDQLFVDFDLSVENLPPGTRLAIGDVVLEISDEPHTGCRKFSARYGKDATKFVNSKVGKQLRLRGVNTRVIRGGRVHRGDAVGKVALSS